MSATLGGTSSAGGGASSASFLPVGSSSVTTGIASTAEPRKKFGKNLNKLTKPPPPPQPNAVSSSRGQGSSRNGLLVLSTKRASSTASASSNLLSKLSGGGGAAPRPLNTPSLRSEVGASTIDASPVRIGDGTGGWGVPAGNGGVVVNHQQQLQQQQAWKVEESAAPHAASLRQMSPQQLKPPVQHPLQGSKPHMPLLAPKGGVSSGYVSSYPGNGTFDVSSGPNMNGRWRESDAVDNGMSHVNPSYSVSGAAPNGASHMVGIVGGPMSPQPTRKAYTASSPKMNSYSPQTPPARLGPNIHLVGPPAPMLNGLPGSNGIGGDDFSSRPQVNGIGSKPTLPVDTVPVTVQNSSHVGVMESELSAGQGFGRRDDEAKAKLEDPAASGSDAAVDDQVQYMSRLARERAEARRIEEERRVKEQKERAARRLRELEQKMSASSVSSRVPEAHVSGSEASAQRAAGSWRQLPQQRSLPKVVTARVAGLGAPSHGGSEIVLERLGRTKNSGSPASHLNSNGKLNSSPVVNVKTVSDPNRTYSSLVGGTSSVGGLGKGAGVFLENGSADDMCSSRQHVQLSHDQVATGSYQIPASSSHQKQHPGLSLSSPSHQYMHQPRMTEEHQQQQPPPPVTVIQLSSYDDQDRGERGRGAGAPRMLFDPKSGSMVEAPSMDKRSGYHGGTAVENDVSSFPAKGGRKERKSKKGSDREKDRTEKGSNKRGEPVTLMTKKRSDSDVTPPGGGSCHSFGTGDSPDISGDGKSSMRKERKDELGSRQPRRERKRPDRKKKGDGEGFAAEAEAGGGVSVDRARSSDRPFQSKRFPQKGLRRGGDHPRLPRTRGVLYKKDDKGNYVCADGCEADQGYGLHSVPGGRVRNPTAYAKFLECQKFEEKSASLSEKGTSKSSRRSPIKNGDKQHPNATPEAGLNRKGGRRHESQQRAERIQVDADLNRANTNDLSQVRGNAVQSLALSSAFEGQLSKLNGFYLPSVSNVTAKDSLTLLTDGPDSPTLQATASPWRPSEAALAAAAAAVVSVPNAGTNSASDANEENGADEDDSGSITSASFGGLGFDPTQNMDSVMMSPSLRSEAGDDEEPMPTLSLEGSADVVKNPFSSLSSPGRFLGGSTWGTGGTLNASPGAPLSIGLSWNLLGTEGGETKAGGAPSANGKQQATASFLSLSPLATKPDVSSTWGAGSFGGSLGGLGQTTLGGGHFRGEDAGGSGD